MVETSGVYMPTGLGNLDRYDKSLFWGTLHPQPFILVKLVKIKSFDSPYWRGSNGGIKGGRPFNILTEENSLKPILCINLDFPEIIYIYIIKINYWHHLKID